MPVGIASCRQQLVLLDNEFAFNAAMIEEREEGIREVVDQIGQANEIVRDLAVEFLSRNKSSPVQLVKASKSVKSRSSWCWWVLVMVVVGVIVFLIVLIL
ncbi:hypothetical protein MLD38_024421 [Melastoma candidum]|uniref:Uncharacterized protein n=1 Tax=Melastoma candidum TaxID=119954 RepID=A0ACB9NS76_9MYRT|nr:hypothetical protein MLD38_024421 [Melastoma candidum]